MVLDRTFPLLHELVAEQALESFFFSREPGGLLLHCASGLKSDRSAEFRILALMQGFHAEQRVGETILERSEPAAVVTGESALTAALADLFQADSVGWWRGERLRRSGAALVSLPLLSLAILNDLFFAVFGVAEEVWDIWCTIASADLPPDEHPGAFRGPRASQPPSVVTLRSLAHHLGELERQLVRTYENANGRFARRLERFIEGGLRIKRRTQVLPLVAKWHFNRYDLSALERRQIYEVMLDMLDPGRGFASVAVRTSA